MEEQLWTDEEGAERTCYDKIIKINAKPKIQNLKEFLDKLYPICFYQEENKDSFRNKVSLEIY